MRISAFPWRAKLMLGFVLWSPHLSSMVLFYLYIIVSYMSPFQTESCITKYTVGNYKFPTTWHTRESLRSCRETLSLGIFVGKGSKGPLWRWTGSALQFPDENPWVPLGCIYWILEFGIGIGAPQFRCLDGLGIAGWAFTPMPNGIPLHATPPPAMSCLPAPYWAEIALPTPASLPP